MQWEATDQFGNLWVGVSDAACIEDLRPHLASLVDQLVLRTEGKPFKVTIDREYGEINGPDPDGVSHVIRCGWVEGLPAEQAQDIMDALEEIRAEKQLPAFSVDLV